MTKRDAEKKLPRLFTVYYMNQEKVFEMRMLLDNEVKSAGTSEQSTTTDLEGKLDVEANAKIPLLSKLKEELEANVNHGKQSKIVDTLEYINTKSRMLSDLLDHCETFCPGNSEEGQLVYIRNARLELLNEAEVRGLIPVMTGTLDGLFIPEAGNVDIGHMLQSIVKTGTTFKLRGTIDGSKESSILLKIPLDGSDLFESKYTIDDLLIGSVSIVGIRKGKIKPSELHNAYEYFQSNESAKSSDVDIIDGSSEDSQAKEKALTEEREKCEYIDVLAIIQDVRVKPSE